MSSRQLLYGVHKVAHALAFIGHSLRDEQYQALVGWQSKLQTSLRLVARTKALRVDSVRNARHALPLKQSAKLRLIAKPLTARNETDVIVAQYGFFLSPNLCREVVVAAPIGQQPAVSTTAMELMTATGIVANGRSWPQVVHRPHHGLTAIQYFFDVGKAQHSLIYPMKMNHVGLLELRQRRNVVARIGYVDIEKPLSLEMQMTEYLTN